MVNSRKISDLLPVVGKKCAAFIAQAKAAGIEVVITSTYRDHASQDALWAIGRTKPGRRVTNAKGGQSFHNFRVAWDFVPVIAGKAVWNDLSLFRRCGEIGEALGCEWGGRWKMRDYPHLQYTGGLTLRQLRAGEVPT
jgi:peptidoglycan L-alanyl-D-glutamate endopeptidase CwlK